MTPPNSKCMELGHCYHFENDPNCAKSFSGIRGSGRQVEICCRCKSQKEKPKASTGWGWHPYPPGLFANIVSA